MKTKTLLVLTLSLSLLAACTSGSEPPPNSNEAGDRDDDDRLELSYSPKGDAVRGVIDKAWAEQAGIDQHTHPEYNVRAIPAIPPYFQDSNNLDILRDPYRLDWEGDGRGIAAINVHRIENRYGYGMAVDLFGPAADYVDPVTGEADAGPYPTLILIPGHGTSTDGIIFEPFAQQLAENGYIVAIVTPMNNARSDKRARDSFSGEIIDKENDPYCDPNGDWRQPQEGGVQEKGECAGEDGPLSTQADALQRYPQVTGDLRAIEDLNAANYEQFRPRFVFSALDAYQWLGSEQNPWQSKVNLNAVAMAGHSAGGDGVLIAANILGPAQVRTVLVWDSHGRPPESIRLQVPAMLQFAEFQNIAGPYPHRNPGSAMTHTGVTNTIRHINEGTDVVAIGLRGSTHSEWPYVPYRLMNPVAPLTNASARGRQVAHYYNLAWLDYHMKPESHRSDAQHRLFARSFDDSADRTAIGTGSWNPVEQRNEPYTIAGQAIDDHLSVWFPSVISFDDEFCFDWQQGCLVEAGESDDDEASEDDGD